MLLHILKSKIHRAIVTEANLEYIGSITIDREIMERAGLVEYEKVLVVNINNGARFETYTIAGKKGSSIICLNGACARLAQIGDKVIILSFTLISEDEVKKFKPKMIFVDDNNRISSMK